MSCPETLFAALRRCPDLDGVDDSVLTELIQAGSVKRYVAGQCYHLQGEDAQEAVFVLKGYLLIGMSDRNGNTHIVRPVTEGIWFNLLPILDGGPALHDTHAAIDSELFVVPKAKFLHIAHKATALMNAVHRLLHQRNRLLYHELAHMALLPLGQRCAQLLVQLMGKAEGGISQVDVSQNELAQMLGYSRPVVNRELQNLAKQGVIEITYHRIAILDVAALRRIALF